MKNLKLWYGFLKYEHVLFDFKYLYRMLKARLWCKKRHNKFKQGMHWTGKYTCCNYRCMVCGNWHTEFGLNKSKAENDPNAKPLN